MRDSFKKSESHVPHLNTALVSHSLILTPCHVFVRKCMLQAETKITTQVVESMVSRLNELSKRVSNKYFLGYIAWASQTN